MHSYLQPLRAIFEQHADTAQAEPMARYMRNKFDFYGIKAPRRRELFKNFISTFGLPAVEQLDIVLRDLWLQPQREYQHWGLDLLQKFQKQVEPGFVRMLEHLIVTKSWWDTVDALAVHPVGTHFARFPQVRAEYLQRWHSADNFWLRRTTLLFQLRYKTETDNALLFTLIRENCESNEFFIQKAIGWALREYSKTNAAAVNRFAKDTELAALSKREALKWLKRKGAAG